MAKIIKLTEAQLNTIVKKVLEQEQNIFTIPIHQRPDNYTLRIFSDSPFPVSLTSMAWEGNYSPRFYRRT